MSWAARRRALYLIGVLVFFGVVVGVPLVIYLYEPPTCFDRIQNQGETAPDLGGPCVLLDARYLTPEVILWARPFEVRPGRYNAAAYIENPNPQAGVRQAAYRFRLYDERNILVAERHGTTYIAPGTITPVFEGVIEAGERRAQRAFFEFTEPLVWERLEDTSSELGVSNERPDSVNNMPRLTARVRNNGVQVRTDLKVVAIVFDTAGNAFAASQTTVDRLPGGAEEDIIFTWPAPFERQVSRIDIIPSTPPR
jgi:hypothetical protein